MENGTIKSIESEPTPLTLRDVEKVQIIGVLEVMKGNRTHTAKALGIGIRTLQRKLKSYGMSEYLKETTEEAK